MSDDVEGAKSDHFILELKDVSKHYHNDEAFVLKNVTLSVRSAEFVALLGPSGSGKSTLLHLAGLLDDPTSGEILINSRKINNIAKEERTRLIELGFVYQYHHLLQEFSAIENVMIPQLILGRSEKEAQEKAAQLLSDIGLADKMHAFPSELSGGQRQRVAIARAVANDPRILLADEPTGNLDQETAAKVFDDLLAIAKKNNMAAIIATHNEDLVAKVDRTYYISEGNLLERK